MHYRRLLPQYDIAAFMFKIPIACIRVMHMSKVLREIPNRYEHTCFHQQCSLGITTHLNTHLYRIRHLTHRNRVTRISVSKLTLIGSDNGLSPGRRQTIIWTNAGILLIGPVGANFSEILIEIYSFSFKKLHLKISSAKWRPCCLGLNVLSVECLTLYPPPSCTILHSSIEWFITNFFFIWSCFFFFFFFFAVLYCIIHLCCPGSIP